MKRIEEPKSKLIFQEVCNGFGCNSKWEITEDDIVKRKTTKRNKCTVNHYGFICPDCNRFTEIRDIPEKVKYKAKLHPGQKYEADTDFNIGDVIEIEQIDLRKIKPIRNNDWDDDWESILYSLCGCRDERIYPTVLGKKKGFITIGFRTSYLSDNYYVFEVPLNSMTAKRVDFHTDIHDVIELEHQSYFYLNEDEKYVYLLVFYYYTNYNFKEAMYENTPYERIKDPKNYWFKESMKNPSEYKHYEPCNISLNEIFNRKLVVKISKEEYYEKAVPVFDFCECLDIERNYIKNILARYIVDFGTDKIADA